MRSTAEIRDTPTWLSIRLRTKWLWVRIPLQPGTKILQYVFQLSCTTLISYGMNSLQSCNHKEIMKMKDKVLCSNTTFKQSMNQRQGQLDNEFILQKLHEKRDLMASSKQIVGSYASNISGEAIAPLLEVHVTQAIMLQRNLKTKMTVVSNKSYFLQQILPTGSFKRF